MTEERLIEIMRDKVLSYGFEEAARCIMSEIEDEEYQREQEIRESALRDAYRAEYE